MPVLGHAFVGLATAMATRPAHRSAIRAALWTPIIIGLAYLPDILSQVIALAGFGSHASVTHSIVVSLAATLLLGWPVARLGGISVFRGAAIVLFSLGAHLLLDLLQATERRPFWPFSDRNVGLGLDAIPFNSLYEVLVFGGFFVAFLVILRRARRSRIPAAGSDASAEVAAAAGGVWIRRCGTVSVSIVLVLAVGTHYLTHVRRQQLVVAKNLINQGNYDAAFEMLDEADRWPAPFRPGSIDFFRGKIWLKLGDRELAETTFLKISREAPRSIYAIEQLALLCATMDGSSEVRAKCLSPWLEVLRERFSDHPRIPRIRQKLRNRLGYSVDLGGN